MNHLHHKLITTDSINNFNQDASLTISCIIFYQCEIIINRALAFHKLNYVTVYEKCIVSYNY